MDRIPLEKAPFASVAGKGGEEGALEGERWSRSSWEREGGSERSGSVLPLRNPFGRSNWNLAQTDSSGIMCGQRWASGETSDPSTRSWSSWEEVW